VGSEGGGQGAELCVEKVPEEEKEGSQLRKTLLLRLVGKLGAASGGGMFL
jgi:hypothetical protein